MSHVLLLPPPSACRYGYADVSELEAVVAGFEAAQLPLEVLWSDIDMYDRARMFTTDSERYPVDRLRGLVDRCVGKSGFGC